MTDKPTHRIVRFEAENVKRLRAVLISPASNVIEITGRNRQGKTSVLDALWWALTPADNIQVSPIRDGEERAKVVLDLGSIIVTRKFTAKEGGTYTTSLTVATPDGMLAQKPATFLSDLVGELTMDPIAFAESKPREKFDALKALVPGVDFDQIELDNRRDFAERTDVNRKLKDVRSQANGIIVPDDTPAEPIDVDELTAELQAAGERNAEIERLNLTREQQIWQVDRRRKEADRAEAKAAELRQQADRLDAEAADLRADADAQAEKIPSEAQLPVDASEIAEKLRQARVINDNVRRRQERDSLARRAADLETESAGLTKAIDDRNRLQQEAIAAAKIPVDGIGFGDGIVLLNGQPFEQASDAEQLEASIAIALARNPRLRVIRVRNGSLLDDEAMRVLHQMADKHDCQIWIEVVDRRHPGAIVIEDGAVSEIIPVEAAE